MNTILHDILLSNGYTPDEENLWFKEKENLWFSINRLADNLELTVYREKILMTLYLPLSSNFFNLSEIENKMIECFKLSREF